MTIQILGTGCAKCRMLEKHAQEAIRKANLDATIEKITDIDEIMNFGVMITPALAVDGVIQSSGKVLTADQIITLLSR